MANNLSASRNTLTEAEICSALAKTPLFDALWYMQTYPDVEDSGLDPFVHYARIGEKKFRKPSRNFDPRIYQMLGGDSGNILYDYLHHSYLRKNFKDEIPIFFAVNEAYARYLGVALASLAYNASPEYKYNIYVLYSSLSDLSRQRIKSQAIKNINIELIDVSRLVTDLCSKAHVTGHISPESYYRILIPAIFPRLDKCLYLDCDIVINDSLVDLYSYDISAYSVGAVEENWQGTTFLDSMKIFAPVEHYFNAGILILNICRFIKYSLIDEFMKHINSGIQFPTHDQDILNLVCDESVLCLPMTWNYMWQFFCRQGYKYADRKKLKEFVDYFENPAIIHYNSNLKPWQINDGHFTAWFWRYAAYSPWFDELAAACPYSLESVWKQVKELESRHTGKVNAD